MKRSKKRAFTLLEIMIVIFLIGLIGAVVSYNMKGSMDKGRAFKTEQAMKQIEDILMLEMAKEDVDATAAAANAETYLRHSGLVKDPKKLLLDGWGNKFEISGNEKGELVIFSKALKQYENKQKKILDNGSIAKEE